MSLPSLIMLAIMGLLLAYTVLSVFIAIVRNLRRGAQFRQDLAQRVGQLRLRKMLGALRIDLPGYLHNNRVVDIEAQMRNCQGCAAQRQCDDELAPEPQAARDYPFCPNYETLKQIAESSGPVLPEGQKGAAA